MADQIGKFIFQYRTSEPIGRARSCFRVPELLLEPRYVAELDRQPHAPERKAGGQSSEIRLTRRFSVSSRHP